MYSSVSALLISCRGVSIKNLRCDSGRATTMCCKCRKVRLTNRSRELIGNSLWSIIPIRIRETRKRLANSPRSTTVFFQSQFCIPGKPFSVFDWKIDFTVSGLMLQLMKCYRMKRRGRYITSMVKKGLNSLQQMEDEEEEEEEEGAWICRTYLASKFPF